MSDPALLEMEAECRSALSAVKAALKRLKCSSAIKAPRYAVVPTAVRDLTALQKALVRVVGPEAPYIWEVIDPEKV